MMTCRIASLPRTMSVWEFSGVHALGTISDDNKAYLHTYCVGADLSYDQDSSALEVWAMPFNTESNL